MFFSLLSMYTFRFRKQNPYKKCILKKFITGKSLSEALIFASINPQCDNRLFMELPVQYMKTTSAEHAQNMFFPYSALVVFMC